MDGLKRGSAAIVGVAESDLGQVADGLSVFDLMAQGVERALDDCGLKLEGRRRAVLGHHPEPAVGPGARRISRASIRHSSARPSSAARRSSITWRMPWARLRSASATSP